MVGRSPSSKDLTFKVEPHLLSHITFFPCHLWIKNLKLIVFPFFDGWGVKGGVGVAVVFMWQLTVGGRQEMGGGEGRWGRKEDDTQHVFLAGIKLKMFFCVVRFTHFTNKTLHI